MATSRQRMEDEEIEGLGGVIHLPLGSYCGKVSPRSPPNRNLDSPPSMVRTATGFPCDLAAFARGRGPRRSRQLTQDYAVERGEKSPTNFTQTCVVASSVSHFYTFWKNLQEPK